MEFSEQSLQVDKFSVHSAQQDPAQPDPTQPAKHSSEDKAPSSDAFDRESDFY